jgi:predicted metalloprotease with PDZ domain
MQYATWLRRAGRITAIGIALLAGRSLLAGDGPAAGKPTPSKETTESKEAKGAKDVAKPQGRVLIPKYRLGAALAPISPALNGQLHLKGEGVLIQRVAPGGPADKAGIKRDDILLAVGDTPIMEYGDLVEASNASGGKASLKLLRGGKTIIVAVTLEKHRKGDEKIFIPRTGAADTESARPNKEKAK